ncbi:multidrug ABC transporter [Lactiplantibacillus paraplantarum]|uniref:ATP-binding cassette domain-containing protein n=1 Tax=Lactiplantibacillus paraplantarum TaxID=60520 RepID=UPI0005134A80|nr:ATP-binding cassette domain-containing protein [Lactiplantibacillus paraplantarum]ALO03544.1 multidrug ABC transporter [Lactiplantibacillus paraplantarum]KGE76581.1 multidrug ABC transporter [Lactiplantibacillus paraplantarum]
MSLVINQLSKQIDHRTTLNQISFTIEPGQIVGVVGRNGVGKTTLFRTINGQYLADSGDVSIDGQVIAIKPQLRTQLCFIDPLANFFKGATIKQIQWYYQTAYPNFNNAKFEQLLNRYHLTSKQKLRHFSKGTFGLFTIILSVATEAPYLFLDEPLDGLDVLIRKNILGILIDEVATGERSIVIASHNLVELEGVIDRALMLKNGQIVNDYQLETMRSNARKVQLVYRDKQIPAVVKQLGRIVHVSGRVIVVVFEDFNATVQTKLAATKPVFQEELPLSLADLFMANLTDEADFELLS